MNVKKLIKKLSKLDSKMEIMISTSENIHDLDNISVGWYYKDECNNSTFIDKKLKNITDDDNFNPKEPKIVYLS